jgi:hypothetical protein
MVLIRVKSDGWGGAGDGSIFGCGSDGSSALVGIRGGEEGGDVVVCLTDVGTVRGECVGSGGVGSARAGEDMLVSAVAVGKVSGGVGGTDIARSRGATATDSEGGVGGALTTFVGRILGARVDGFASCGKETDCCIGGTEDSSSVVGKGTG